MRFFSLYLRQRRRDILVFLLFTIIFEIIFILYHLPAAAVVYPAALCGLFSIILMAADYSYMRKKHEFLCEIKKLPAAMISEMPDIECVEDQDYQAIIQGLQNELSKLETVMENHYQDMVDYYTAWVHQIKTPIASMRLTLENEDTQAARRLSSDLFRIEQYVSMVLAFLRLDLSSHDYVFKEYSLDGIIGQAVSKFAAEFIDRKIKLIYEPVGLKIVTDDKWLSFVMEQLISNALKYTRKGSIKIYMREPHILCIEDTGIGIAPEDLPRIFEKGYTGYNGRRDKTASGIGLYLCRRICGNLGVEINIFSQIGRGTAVCMNLEQYDLKLLTKP